MISHQNESRSGAGGYRRLSEELLRYPRQLLSRLSSLASRDSSSEEFWALKDVSFEVQEGEVLGIIGRNGAGKSTLLKILSRITEPTSGRVTLRGRVASLLEVGTGFHPELTGRENIFLNGAILGMTRGEIKRKFDEIVDFAGVEKFLDTPVKRYSSGMYVRLAFAVAAHLDPEILVIDEVLAVGDAEFQNKCLGKMRNVAESGRTVLFVSHNMGAVSTLCTSAILLDNGRADCFATAQQAVTKYHTSSLTSSEKAGFLSRRVTPSLELVDINPTPKSIESGACVEITLTFLATASLELSDLSILLYSTTGVRLGILDLRQKLLPVSLPRNKTWEVRCKLRTMPLVEGIYSIGLYVRTEEAAAEFRDLSVLNVMPKANRGQQTPYASEHLGHITLDFSASACESITHDVA